jgi:hypothetical protein
MNEPQSRGAMTQTIQVAPVNALALKFDRLRETHFNGKWQ